MSFSKTGAIFKIASAKTLSSKSEWVEFKKTAAKQQVAEVKKEQQLKKESDFDVVAAVDTDKFIYIHTTIMAGVKVGENGYTITPETEKFINDNNDSWTCADLMKDYSSFRSATTFVEHDQRIENAKGKCIDAIARQMPDTVLIDVLFSVAKKHTDLVDNINMGIVNAVSMGCSTEKTICSICGNEAKTPDSYCDHIKNKKGQMVQCEDGVVRKAAEICKNNTFFDVSLVANPAFIGAVFRKVLSTSDQIDNQLLANLLARKIESHKIDGGMLLKAASKDENNIEIAMKDDSVEIKEGEKQVTLPETIPEKERTLISEVLKDSKKSTRFLDKIVKRFFGREAAHPILNTTDNDYSISRNDYTPIPYNSPYHTVDDFQECNCPELEIVESSKKSPVKTSSRFEQFECFNCNYTEDLWKVRAASIDNGSNEVVTCPECGFMTENTDVVKANVKTSFKPSRVDMMQLKDLGFSTSDVKKLTEDQMQVILTKDITKKMFQRNPNVGLMRANVLHNITRSLLAENGEKLDEKIEELRKGQVFTASKDIPVDDDEGALHFDEYGASVITKNERLKFIGTVQNGEYGLFKTQIGEEFFMPLGAKKNNS